MKINGTEDTCKRTDELSQQDHSKSATREERERRTNTWRFTQLHTGKDTTVTRNRADFNDAGSKFREAKKTAVARGEVATESIPLRNRVPQRTPQSRQQHSQQPLDLHPVSIRRLAADEQESVSRQTWWSSSYSSTWRHRWQDWHSS